MKKLSAAAAIVLSLAMALSGCAQPAPAAPAGEKEPAKSAAAGDAAPAQGEPVTLSMMHFYTPEELKGAAEARAFIEMVNTFKANNPNVTIEETSMAQADYHVKVMALAAGNNMPDVFLTKGSWVKNFADNSLMGDISKDVDENFYRPGMLGPFKVGDALYCLPVGMTVTSIVYYNEAMWKDIGYDTFPDSWDDVLAANEKFKAKGITTMALGNKDKWPYESCFISSIGDRYTGTAWTESIIKNDGTAKFTDPEFVSALAISQKIAPIFNPDFNSLTNQQGDMLYSSGKTASVVSGIWNVSYLIANASEEIIENTQLKVLPQVEGQKGEKNTTAGGAGWAVSINNKLEGERRTTAVNLIKQISSEGFAQYVMEDSGLVSHCEAPNADTSKLGTLSKKFIEFTNNTQMVPVYDIQMDGSVIDIMNSKLQELLSNNATPEDVAASIQAAQDKVAK